jgi:uncharacterized pyridoxal phosphate-containing UPF0001 family protein
MKLGLFVTNKDTKEPIEDLSSKNTNNYYDNVKYAKEDAQAVYEEAESEGLNVIVEIFETNPQGDKVGELIDTVDKIDKGEALEVDEEGDTQYATASSKVKGSKIEAKYYQDLSPDIQEAIHNGLYKQISEDLSGYFNESDITDMKNNPEKKDLFMEETIDNMINVSNDHNSIKEWVNEFYLNIEGSVKTKVKAEDEGKIKKRLEELRKEIENETISYGEIAELQSLVKYIDPSDVLLLEWAGVPEFGDDKIKGSKVKAEDEGKIKKRLEELRKEIENETISYGEIAELQSLVKYIDPSDVLLLEWAGVPEFGDDKIKGSKVKAEELSEMDKKAITAGEEYGKEISDEIRNKTREVIEGLKEEYEIDRAITPTFNLFINEVKNAVANMKS